MNRRLLTIALAALLAVFGVVAVLAYVRQANNRAVNGLKAETVMVADGAIPAGTSLSDAQQQHLLTTEQVPNSSLSTPAVQSVTNANKHLVMGANVAKGQVLLQNMLVSRASAAASPVVTISIPPGDVAVTVQLCAAEAVANYLTAGAHVDVYETLPTNPKASVQRTCATDHVAELPNEVRTEPVLEDVEVLSVTHALPPGAQSTASGSSSVVADPVSSALSQDAVAVTFAVTRGQEAAMLIQDAQVGLPYLALLPVPSGGN